MENIQTILDKFHVKPVCEDYPTELKPFMGRRIWTDRIDFINANPEKWGVFVKPDKDKAFTGTVINGPRDLVGCGSCYETAWWRHFARYQIARWDAALTLRWWSGMGRSRRFFWK